MDSRPGRTLRTLRKRAGLSQVRLVKRCNVSQSKISKIETGEITPSPVDVEPILRALEAAEQLIAEIATLARGANTEWEPIRSSWRRGARSGTGIKRAGRPGTWAAWRG
ncbi:helix-turn-helix domain-containing protein [Streptomyces sp. NPDC002078]